VEQGVSGLAVFGDCGWGFSPSDTDYLVFSLVLGRISSNLSQEQGFRYLATPEPRNHALRMS